MRDNFAKLNTFKHMNIMQFKYEKITFADFPCCPSNIIVVDKLYFFFFSMMWRKLFFWRFFENSVFRWRKKNSLCCDRITSHNNNSNTATTPDNNSNNNAAKFVLDKFWSGSQTNLRVIRDFIGLNCRKMFFEFSCLFLALYFH